MIVPYYEKNDVTIYAGDASELSRCWTIMGTTSISFIAEEYLHDFAVLADFFRSRWTDSLNDLLSESIHIRLRGSQIQQIHQSAIHSLPKGNYDSRPAPVDLVFLN